MAICRLLRSCNNIMLNRWPLEPVDSTESDRPHCLLAQSREAWLRRFLVLKNGVPSEDTFLRLFRALDPKQFEACFRRWVGGVVTALGTHLVIDGKTVRGSASAGE